MRVFVLGFFAILMCSFVCTASVFGMDEKSEYSTEVSTELASDFDKQDKVAKKVIFSTVAVSFLTLVGVLFSNTLYAYGIPIAVAFPIITTFLINYRDWIWWDQVCKRPRADFSGLGLDFVNNFCKLPCELQKAYARSTLINSVVLSSILTSGVSVGIYALASIPL